MGFGWEFWVVGGWDFRDVPHDLFLLYQGQWHDLGYGQYYQQQLVVYSDWRFLLAKPQEVFDSQQVDLMQNYHVTK